MRTMMRLNPSIVLGALALSVQLQAAESLRITPIVRDNKVVEWRVNIKLTFIVS